MDSNRVTITVHEMASQLGISYPTAYALANRADFPSIRVGKKILIPIQTFQVWLEKEASHDRDTY